MADNKEDKKTSPPSEQEPDESSDRELKDEQLAKVSGGASRCGKCGQPLESCICNFR